MPLEKHDQAIQHHPVNTAYPVLIASMIVVGCVMPSNSNGSIINAALFMIILAEMVR